MLTLFEAREHAAIRLTTATPVTMGTRESHTRRETAWRSKRPESRHAQKGPALLTTCTKETVPVAVASTPVRWPMPCNAPMGSSVRIAANDSRGGARSRVVHRRAAKAAPTTTCSAAVWGRSASAVGELRLCPAP